MRQARAVGPEVVHGPGSGLDELETEAVRGTEPAAAGGKLLGSAGNRRRGGHVQVIDEDSQVGQAPFGSFEVRSGHELQPADGPNLRGGVRVAVDLGHDHPQDVAEEFEVPGQVVDTDGDMLEEAFG